MAKDFQELFEPTALSPALILSRREKKRYRNKITLVETVASDGDYRSLFLKDDLIGDERLLRRLSAEIAACLRFFLEKYGVQKKDKVLVAALGNEQVTADKLGCAVCDKLIATSHLFPALSEKYGNLSCVKCGVSGATGIESFSLLKAVVEREKPKIVFAVDALACGKTERLAKAVQLSDAGIEPGGGVGNAKKILSRQSLHTPIVAIGVPTVMYARKILAEFCKGDFSESETLKTLTVAAKEIDYQIKDFSTAIADAVNTAVHCGSFSR